MRHPPEYATIQGTAYTPCWRFDIKCLASTISSGQRRLFFPTLLLSIAAVGAVEKTLRGKVFRTFPPRLVIPQLRGITTFPQPFRRRRTQSRSVSLTVRF